MYGLFLNTYYDHPGTSCLIRVSAVKENLVESVEGDEVPLLFGECRRRADNKCKSHYEISEIEEI